MPGKVEVDQIKSEEDIQNKKFMDLFHNHIKIGKGGFGACSIVIHYDSGLRLTKKYQKLKRKMK